MYTSALSTGLIQKDIEEIVAIVLAGSGAERRKAEANPEGDFFSIDSDCENPDCHLTDQEAWVSLIKVLEEGIAMVRAGGYSFELPPLFLADLCLSSKKSRRPQAPSRKVSQ